jgi:hypothetical protein
MRTGLRRAIRSRVPEREKMESSEGIEPVSAPRLSIVVVAYRMARQALNTIYTLSPANQREVEASDYEIVVVENESDANLDEDALGSLGPNVRYLRRQETGVSPAAAINAGLAMSRGRYLGLMIDGARMVSPRVVRYALDAFAITDQAVVAVPGYHIGGTEHHYHRTARYDEAVEWELLATVDWRSDSYRLFEISCFSGANPHGFFHPFLESNCMFAARENFVRIGGADERFDLPGGGALNPHMYRALGMLPGTRLFVLPGEGSFHQFHGGVTTSETEGRDELLDRQLEQVQEIWGGSFQSLRREAVMLGAVTGRVMPFLEMSAARGRRRYDRMRYMGRAEWADEPGDGGSVIPWVPRRDAGDSKNG